MRTRTVAINTKCTLVLRHIQRIQIAVPVVIRIYRHRFTLLQRFIVLMPADLMWMAILPGLEDGGTFYLQRLL